jgi:hypothetical protein
MAGEIAQIQIVPVDNGFFIQCVNADGSGSYNPRKVANTRDELELVMKEIAEVLYTKEPPPPPGRNPHQPSPTAVIPAPTPTPTPPSPKLEGAPLAMSTDD